VIDIPNYDWSRLTGLGFDLDFVERALSKNYKKGLTKGEQDVARREAKETMAKAERSGTSSKELYKDWDSDKSYRSRNPEIPKSKATEAFEANFDGAESGVDSALKNKSEKSGIPLGILKSVYSRGMAAWRSGHRPGVAPQQWALARVNSFITGSGKARQADSDLWKKYKGGK
jgi:hypothetical protein